MWSPASNSVSEKVDDEDDEFEPLFDYSHIQPPILVDKDDESDDDGIQIVQLDPIFGSNGKKRPRSHGKEEPLKGIVPDTDAEEAEEEDWLPPPPKSIKVVRISADENSILSKLRLKREELMSLTTESTEEMLHELGDSTKKERLKSIMSNADTRGYDAIKPPCTRKKIIITIQNKEGGKQFRIYVDDRFEKLFKTYAEYSNGQRENLVFCFDGEKIPPYQTPEDLGMVDEDIIEVYSKTG
eukprot:Gb_32180 [translate_table: standard]